MKYSLAFVFLVAVASTVGYPLEDEYKLAVDLHDFAMLMSREQAIAIGLDYLQNDEEVQRFVHFAMSDRMKDLMLKVEAIHDYQNVLRLVQTTGIDIYGLLTAMHKALGMPSYVPPPNYLKMNAKVNAPGIKGLFETLEKLMPLDELAALKQEKLATSPEFKRFYDLITSSEYQRLACKLEANTDFQHILADAEKDAFYPFIIRDWAFKLWGIAKRVC